MRESGTNKWTFYEPEIGDEEILPPAPGDALSDPAVEDLLPSGLSLWPRGAAWGTPDGMAANPSSVLAGFTRALLGPFAGLYARLYRLTNESRALTLVDGLGDWERDYGLPSKCSIQGRTTAGRRRALLSRVRSTATITPQDFVRLARIEGFYIAIEEPATFECGFSECGGEHTTGDIRQEVFWVAHVFNLSVEFFTVGESEIGFDRLFQIGEIDRLRCLFQDLTPAWTQAGFLIYDSLSSQEAIPLWLMNDDPWSDSGFWVD